jgi:hypothetical protein
MSQSCNELTCIGSSSKLKRSNTVCTPNRSELKKTVVDNPLKILGHLLMLRRCSQNTADPKLAYWFFLEYSLSNLSMLDIKNERAG